MRDYFNPIGKLDEDIFMIEDNEGEDYEHFIFLKVPKTNHPHKYSEGVFSWGRTDEEGNISELYSSLEYQVQRGGDAEVFWAWVNENKDTLKKLKP